METNDSKLLLNYFSSNQNNWKDNLTTLNCYFEDSFKSGKFGGILEAQWRLIIDEFGFEMMNRNEIINFNNPFEALNYYLEKNVYPPPELLMIIYQLYKNYLDKAGEKTFDEICFGPPKQKIGNYSAQRIKNNETDHQFRNFYKLIQLNEDHSVINSTVEIFNLPNSIYFGRLNSEEIKIIISHNLKEYEHYFDLKNSNQTILAEIYLKLSKLNLKPDADTFLRSYRRWKRLNITDI